MHPNCTPTPSMKDVCAAAAHAAQRNERWEYHEWKTIRGVRGRQNRILLCFNVTFGGGTQRLYLSQAGVLFQKTSDGLIPIELGEYSSHQHDLIARSLNSISAVPQL